MTCTPFGGNGFSGVICSRGRRTPRCSVPGCDRPGERECDFVVSLKKSGTCDAKLCTVHAHRYEGAGVGKTGEPLEFCPPHVKLIAYAEQRSSKGSESMEKIQGIETTCGTCHRVQRLFTPDFGREYAAELAALMDGTTKLFVHPPKPDRSDCLPGSMGRCSSCALGDPPLPGVFTCKLFGYDEPPSAKVIQMATRVEIEPTISAITLESEVVPRETTRGRTSTNSTTTDGKPPRPGFEDAGAPGPIGPDGMHLAYYVLTEEERAKGFVRPVRTSYKHVGTPGPKLPLRPLTEEERERYGQSPNNYIGFEAYPDGDAITGRYWTQAQLDRVGRGCGTVTSMSRPIAETYARDPSYYGSTFCAGCRTHLPVGADGEFVWAISENQHFDGERVGT